MCTRHSLLELKNAGCKAYGVDPEPTAKELVTKFGIKFKQGFIQDNPFTDQKFDYITANQVLEHTNDPIKFLKDCKKRLKKNGKIILSFPNNDSLTRYLFKRNWLHWHLPYHLNFFNRKSFELSAKKAGLSIEMLKTTTPNMWSNLQLRRLLQKPLMGKRDTFWDGKGDDTKLGKIGYLTKLIRLLEEYNYLNRVIDLFGFGESFVTILST